MTIKSFNYAKYFRSFFVGILMVMSTALHAAATAPMPPMPGMPEMSEAEMQKFMSELESTAKEIDNFVNSLPPEEQAEFNKAVQEVEQMINNMSPEELEQFIGGMFGGPQAEEPQRPAEPEPVVEERKEVKVPELSTKELSEQEKAIDLIDAIIKKTQSFIVKAQGMPELASKARRWGQQRKIRNWQADTNWNTVKSAIDRLVEKLHKMKDKDPKTNQYKFLKDFIEDKALYNNLSLLRSNLDQYESNIEVSAFGLAKMPAKSKNSLQQIISSFTESLYVLKTPEALNTIIAKYEPRAKELAEEEKKVEKRAQSAQRPPRAAQTVVGGTPEAEEAFYGGGYGGGYDDYGYGGGYNGGGYGGYSPAGGDYSMPSYSSPAAGTPSMGRAGTTGAAGKETAQEKGPKEKEGKPTAIAPSETAPKEEVAKKAPKKMPFQKEIATAEIYLDEITDELSNMVNKIKSTPLLNGNVAENIQKESNETIGTNIQAINSIKEMIENTEKQISKLKLKAKVPALKKTYKQRLENIFKEIKVEKTTIKPKVTLDTLMVQLDNVKKDQLPMIKQFAYFGGEVDQASQQGIQQLVAIQEKEAQVQDEEPVELTEEEQAIKQKYEPIMQTMKKMQGTPANVTVLRDMIQSLLDDVRNFDKEQN